MARDGRSHARSWATALVLPDLTTSAGPPSELEPPLSAGRVQVPHGRGDARGGGGGTGAVRQTRRRVTGRRVLDLRRARRRRRVTLRVGSIVRIDTGTKRGAGRP